MNNNEFLKIMDGEYSAIRKLFEEKNKSYGGKDDTFHNFRQTAVRLFGRDNPEDLYYVAEILVDKHNVALAKGINVSECRERLRDRIVYSLIEIAMIDEKLQKKEHATCTLTNASNCIRGNINA